MVVSMVSATVRTGGPRLQGKRMQQVAGQGCRKEVGCRPKKLRDAACTTGKHVTYIVCRVRQYVPCRAHLHIGVNVAPQRLGRLRCDFATVSDTDQGEVALVGPPVYRLPASGMERALDSLWIASWWLQCGPGAATPGEGMRSVPVGVAGEIPFMALAPYAKERPMPSSTAK